MVGRGDSSDLTLKESFRKLNAIVLFAVPSRPPLKCFRNCPVIRSGRRPSRPRTFGPPVDARDPVRVSLFPRDYTIVGSWLRCFVKPAGTNVEAPRSVSRRLSWYGRGKLECAGITNLRGNRSEIKPGGAGRYCDDRGRGRECVPTSRSKNGRGFRGGSDR